MSYANITACNSHPEEQAAASVALAAMLDFEQVEDEIIANAKTENAAAKEKEDNDEYKQYQNFLDSLDNVPQEELTKRCETHSRKIAILQHATNNKKMRQQQ